MDKVFQCLKRGNYTLESFETILESLGDDSEEWNKENKFGESILHFTMKLQDSTAASLLLRYVPSSLFYKCETSSGLPILPYTIDVVRESPLVQLLLEYPAAVEACVKHTKFTPLHWACRCNATPVLPLLISSQRNYLNAPCEFNGDTPLIVACRYSAEDAARILILSGADCQLPNAKQERALHLAIENKLVSIIPLLVDCESFDVHLYKDVQGNTPLHLAEAKRMNTLAQLLCEKGFSDQVPNHGGITPQDIREEYTKTMQAKQVHLCQHKEKMNQVKKSLRDVEMYQTEVSCFCKEKHLDELIPFFFKKKFFLLNEEFQQLNIKKLRKLGLSLNQCQRFTQALAQHLKDLNYQQEVKKKETRLKRRKQVILYRAIGIIYLTVFFFLIFLILKFVERRQRGLQISE